MCDGVNFQPPELLMQGSRVRQSTVIPKARTVEAKSNHCHIGQDHNISGLAWLFRMTPSHRSDQDYIPISSLWCDFKRKHIRTRVIQSPMPQLSANVVKLEDRYKLLCTVMIH